MYRETLYLCNGRYLYLPHGEIKHLLDRINNLFYLNNHLDPVLNQAIKENYSFSNVFCHFSCYQSEGQIND